LPDASYHPKKIDLFRGWNASRRVSTRAVIDLDIPFLFSSSEHLPSILFCVSLQVSIDRKDRAATLYWLIDEHLPEAD
jgi:hypothetical protein